MSSQDLWITISLSIFIIQYVIMSLMLFKRGVASEYLVTCASPILCIWVIVWPIYHQSTLIPYSIALIALPLVAAQWPYPLTQQLKRSWSGSEFGFLPMITMVLNLGMAAILFTIEPAFGFAIALSLCLGVSAANLVDKLKRTPLLLPFNPHQTLWGHLVLILLTTILCSWSLHIYFSVPQFMTWPVAGLAALAASLGRAIIPNIWSSTGVVFGIAVVLWLF